MVTMTEREPGEYSERARRARVRSATPARVGVHAARESLRRLAVAERFARTRSTSVFALQCAIAAGLAWFIAHDLIGHTQPFFAPIAAVISLGVGGGKRMRRGFELLLGATVGIGIGDLVISQIGGGGWQITIVVFVAMMLAVFVDKGPLVPNQAASSAVLVATLIPPGDQAGWERMIDCMVGGILGLIVVAVIPNNPLRAARREIAGLISKAALVLDDVAQGIEDRDGQIIGEALETARGTQANVNDLMSAASGGDEVMSLSPIYWTARRYSKSMNRILSPVDNVMRNSRVLARRAEIMVEDGVEPSPEMPRLIRDISDALGHLGTVHASGGTRATRQELVEIPEITRRLQLLAARSGVDVAEGAGLSGSVVLAQCRSIIVDTLQVCGMSRESAMAVLKPTVSEPQFPPEVWRDDSGDTDGRA
ncbi:MAG TPA: FUSC family protein [Candidatus Corynebacterium avicola]|uniref:FUSC family protein n=1 Tax=Candidatus Corynebacterium avicola TaxID=2838527 RepID=A0A9D1RN20_9CORY|nr:FUSC family protein [Candidatus Corynebacterium avicola]